MNAPVKLGVLGMGRAFTLMVPTFAADPRIKLVAAFDPRPGARERFVSEFGGCSHDTPEAVCANPEVEWVYVATPHGLHAEHVKLAAHHGRHVLVEKPMALTLADCDTMVDACERAGVQLIVGHSHSHNAPVRLALDLISQGAIGRVRFVHAMQFTDFLYRPRRPEELDTARGGAWPSARPRISSTSFACSRAAGFAACAPLPADGIRRAPPKVLTPHSSFLKTACSPTSRTTATDSSIPTP